MSTETSSERRVAAAKQRCLRCADELASFDTDFETDDSSNTSSSSSMLSIGKQGSTTSLIGSSFSQVRVQPASDVIMSPLELGLDNAPAPASREDRRARLYITMCYMGAFLVSGIGDALLGPTLKSLGTQTNADVAELSVLFTVRSFAAAFGGLLAGFLVDRMPGHPWFSFAAGWVTVLFFIIPSCTSYWQLVLAFLVLGVGRGMINNVSQMQVIRLQGDNLRPFVQSIHCSWAVGASLAPLVARNFINQSADQSSTNVGGAYYLTGSFFFVCMLWSLWWTLRPGSVPKAVPSQSHSAHGSKDLHGLPTDDGSAPVGYEAVCSYRVTLVVLTSIFLCLYVGYEASFGGLVFTYAVDGLGFTPSDGALLTTVYWGLFCLGRFAGVPLSVWLTPLQMLVIDLSGGIVALVLLLAFPHSNNMLWLGAGLFGLFLSSMYPSAFTVCEQEVRLTGKIVGFLLVGDTGGEMTVPLLAGNLMDSRGPITLIYVCLGCYLASIVAVVVFQSVRLASVQRKRAIALSHSVGLSGED